MDVKFMIAVTEAEEAAKQEVDLKDKIIAAMKVTEDHWMITDEDLRFKAAIAGAISACLSENSKERIIEEVNALSCLSTMLSGGSVDLSEIKMPENPIGLMKLWMDIKEENKK